MTIFKFYFTIYVTESAKVQVIKVRVLLLTKKYLLHKEKKDFKKIVYHIKLLFNVFI